MVDDPPVPPSSLWASTAAPASSSPSSCGGRPKKREREPVLAEPASGGAAGHERRGGSSSSLMAGIGGLGLAASFDGRGGEEEGEEDEGEAEAAILTGQAIKRLRIASSPSFPTTASAASCGEEQQQQQQQQQLHQQQQQPSLFQGQGPTALPSTQQFVPSSSTRSSINTAPMPTTSRGWATVPSSLEAAGPGEAASSFVGRRPTSVTTVAAGTETMAAGGGGSLESTSLFGPRSAGGDSGSVGAGGIGSGPGHHRRTSSIGSSSNGGGGGLTRSLSDPCLHSPTASSATSAVINPGGGGAGGSAATPAAGRLSRSVSDELSHSHYTGDGDAQGGALLCSTPGPGPDPLRVPSSSSLGEDGGGGDVDYSLINSMLGRLHFDRVHRTNHHEGPFAGTLGPEAAGMGADGGVGWAGAPLDDL